MPKISSKTAGLTYEHWYWNHNNPQYRFRCITGIDEAGRGAWAGPVAAGAVCLPPASADDSRLLDVLAGVRDSKTLSARQRESLVDQIKTTAIAWGVGSASSTEIDDMGINKATKLAMARALQGMQARFSGFEPDCLFLDSVPWPEAPLSCHRVNIRGGDRLSLSVAAASILAKVWRDEVMQEMDAEFPGYGFAVHKGYGTATHKAALAQNGPSGVHRFCYRPVKELTFRSETILSIRPDNQAK